MTLAEEYIHSAKYPEHFMIVADVQTHGRGRKADDWLSTLGGLWFNLVLNHITTQKSFTLFIGFCVAKALNDLTNNRNFKIKWPNDIYLNEIKVCGIICAQFESLHKTSIGIGIDTNNNSAYPSIKQILGLNLNNQDYLNKIVDNIMTDLQSFEQFGVDIFSEYYQKHDYLDKKQITVISGNEIINGFYKGINENGGLLLKINDEEKVIYSGTIRN